MKRAIFAALLLSGCATEDRVVAYKPITTTAEWCAQFAEAIVNPYRDPTAISVLREKARNMGCLGTAQPQTLIIR